MVYLWVFLIYKLYFLHEKICGKMSLMCSLWNQAWILYVSLLWFLYLLLSSKGQGRWKFHSRHSPGASIAVVAERNSQRKETMRKPSQCNFSLESDSLLYSSMTEPVALRCCGALRTSLPMTSLWRQTALAKVQATSWSLTPAACAGIPFSHSLIC